MRAYIASEKDTHTPMNGDRIERSMAIQDACLGHRYGGRPHAELLKGGLMTRRRLFLKQHVTCVGSRSALSIEQDKGRPLAREVGRLVGTLRTCVHVHAFIAKKDQVCMQEGRQTDADTCTHTLYGVDEGETKKEAPIMRKVRRSAMKRRDGCVRRKDGTQINNDRYSLFFLSCAATTRGP